MSPLAQTEALQSLVTKAKSREALGADLPAEDFVRSLQADRPQMYRNHNERLNIDFTVERLGFAETQTMDPRVVRIAPRRNNELHKHAHESLFVILEGEGEVKLGDDWRPVRAGDFVFVPRWIFHQTRNTSTRNELVVLAVTDFGFTSAVLGDYDKRTRLGQRGDQAEPGTVEIVKAKPKRPKRGFFSWLFGT